MDIKNDLLAVARAGTNAAKSVGSRLASGSASSFVTAATYSATCGAWWTLPHLMPDVEAIVSAYHQGVLTPNDVRLSVQFHGISLPNNFNSVATPIGLTRNQWNWSRIVQAQEGLVPLDTAYRQHKLGIITNVAYNNIVDLHGFARSGSKELVKNPTLIPTAIECTWAWQRGFLTDDELQMYLEANGLSRQNERDLVRKMSYQWPTPTDLIPFAVKDIWIPEIVQRFQYDADFPAVFQTFMNHAGLGWKPSDLGVVVPPAQDITWPQAYWRSHWQVLSPTQAGTAVSFLRPAVPGSPKSRRPGIPAFTEGDFDLIMRTADYPPIMREWLRGLAYAALTRVDIRRMYNLGVVDRDEVLQLYMDIGYDATNAELLTKFTEQEREQRQNSRNKARLESIIRKLYLSCVYSKDDFVRATYAIRRPTTEKRNKFLNLSEAEQLAEANQDANIQLEVNVLGLERKAKRQNRVVGHIQSLARQGLGTTPQFAEWLEKAGVQPDCIGPMIDDMLLEWEMRRKEPTVAQMLRYVTRGAVTPQEVAGRLLNLGYKSNDVAAMIGIAQQDAAAKIAAQQKALASNLRQEQRAQQAQLAALRRQRNEVIADLNKSATKAELLRLYRKGLISAAETRVALLQRGVFERDADAMIKEATPNEEG